MTCLSRRRLEWLVRARGTDLAAWPARDRSAALELMRHSPDARRIFTEALVAEEAPESDCAVLCRMQAALRASLAPLPPLWRAIRAGALVACIGAGIYLATIAQTEADTASMDPFADTQTFGLAALDQ